MQECASCQHCMPLNTAYRGPSRVGTTLCGDVSLRNRVRTGPIFLWGAFHLKSDVEKAVADGMYHAGVVRVHGEHNALVQGPAWLNRAP